MPNDAPRKAVSRKEVAHYWALEEPEHCFVVDLGEPACFACGWYAKRWKTWNIKQLERCHLVPHSLGGDEALSNIVLLCSDCHRSAPDVGDRQVMIDWIKRRPHSLYTRARNVLNELKAQGVTDEEMEEWFSSPSVLMERLNEIKDEICLHLDDERGARLSASTFAYAVKRVMSEKRDSSD